MGSIAGVKLVEVIKNIHSVLSIELLTSAQAMNFRRPRKSSPELERLFSDFRNKIPYIKEDVIMHDLIIKSEKFLLENI